MQCFFTSYSFVYIFYSVDIDLIYRIIKYLFHLYPPFLFSKCFTDLARTSGNHFEQSTFKWEEVLLVNFRENILA